MMNRRKSNARRVKRGGGTRAQGEEVSEILIIGYGNLLRGDDGVGCHAACALEEAFRNDSEVEVIASQQLTPEMAEDVSRRAFVLFIDASFGETPGMIKRAVVAPDAGPASFSHYLTPSSLLTAAEQLYGDAPPAMSLTLAGWCFEMGSKMSAGARLRMPDLLRQAKETIASHRQSSHGRHLQETR
jgi:hydrogenase maturation protease